MTMLYTPNPTTSTASAATAGITSNPIQQTTGSTGSVSAVAIPGGVHTITSANTPTYNPNPTGTFAPSGSSFAQLLQQMFSNFQNPGTFGATSQTTAAPAWTPGMNPFAGSYTAQAAPSVLATGQFAAPPNTFANNVQSALSGWLENPSAYNAPQVQQAYNYLSQNIDDQYTQDQQRLEEDMARRGLSASSIRGGRLSDLNVARKSAREQLANQLMLEQAQTEAQDRASAIAAAMGYGNQQFSQGLASAQQNQSANQQNFMQGLAAAAFAGDQNAQQIMQGLNVSNFNLNLANTGFQNQLAGAGFNAGQNQQGFQNQLNSYLTNLTGNQQGFGQQQQLLANMLGYNQQDFQNQLATYQANQGQNQWYQNLLAWLASQGANA